MAKWPPTCYNVTPSKQQIEISHHRCMPRIRLFILLWIWLLTSQSIGRCNWDTRDVSHTQALPSHAHHDLLLNKPHSSFSLLMMTQQNGNMFRVTGRLWPLNSPHKGQWRRPLILSFICAWRNGWVNRDAGDLRHHRAPNNVTVMAFCKSMSANHFCENCTSSLTEKNVTLKHGDNGWHYQMAT